MSRMTPVELPNAAIQHMSPVARGHLPEHLQGNFPVAGGENLDGATIGYSYVAGHVAIPSQPLTVGPGIELQTFPGIGPSVGYMDIFGASLLIHFTSNASFPDGLYEFILTDPYNEVPNITDVTLVNNGGSASLIQSDITFDANQVTVNLAGTSFTAGSDIQLNFQFL